MHWGKDAEQGLPPRHHREPGSLRRDIIDELADHLVCASERESDAVHDKEDVVRTRVLDQFGDPATIARGLWWDAMKETIMRDRILFALVVVLCLSVLGFLGIFYNNMKSTNRALLTALNDRPSMAEELYPSVEFIVTRGSEDGRPAEGIEVTLTGLAFNENTSRILETTDPNGHVRFGPIRAGSYRMTYDDKVTGLTGSQSVTLYTGTGLESLRVVAPNPTPKSLSFTMPEMGYVIPDKQAVILELTDIFQHGDTTWSKNMLLALDNGKLTKVSYQRPYDPAKASNTTRRRQGTEMNRTQSPRAFYAYAQPIEFFGESLTFQSVRGVFKKSGFASMDYSTFDVADRDRESVPNESQRRALDHQKIAMEPMISVENGMNITLQLPASFIDTYTLFSRKTFNDFGETASEMVIFASDLNKSFPRHVIHDVIPVGKSLLGITDNSSKIEALYKQRLVKDDRGNRLKYDPFTSTSPIFEDLSRPITGNRGWIYSTENLPNSVSDNDKVLLVFPTMHRELKAADHQVGFYAVRSPIDFDNVQKQEPFEARIDEKPWYTISAKEMVATIPGAWTIDFTPWTDGSNGFSDASGVMVKWSEKTENFLYLETPENGFSQQPFWVVLRSYSEVAPQ